MFRSSLDTSIKPILCPRKSGPTHGHDEPIFPDRSRDREVDGPNRLWVADLTYIAILGGFVYLAAIMDAWSRRIVGYAIGRRIDARLTLAALATAIEGRNPPVGCIHHSDRGSQVEGLSSHGPVTRYVAEWLENKKGRIRLICDQAKRMGRNSSRSRSN